MEKMDTQIELQQNKRKYTKEPNEAPKNILREEIL
jgi:hypothetical protein